MEYLTFNRDTVGGLRHQNAYFQKVITICSEWLAGKTEYRLHTSGSTGTPKEISITAAQMRASARATEKALELPSGTRALVCLQVDYIAGLMMLVRGMELGWELTVSEPAANPLLGLPESSAFDFTALVPMQLMEVLVNENTQTQAKKLGKILLGGSEITARQAELFKALQQPVFHGYGMTETVSHVALRQVKDGRESVYTVLDGLVYGLDERGCLYFEGAVTDFKRIRTNDKAVMLPDRGFQLSGRIDNIINSGGVKIQVEKVEKALEQLFHETGIPNTFFVWHEPDERLGQKVILVVEGPVEAATRALLENLHGLALTRYEYPKTVYFVEKISKTGSDKTDRSATVTALQKRINQI